MFGFIIGTLCLIGLIRLLRRSGRWGCYGRFGGYEGYRGYGHGGRHVLRFLFERLQTNPGQEKAVVAAVGEFREAMGNMQGEIVGSRADLARAMKAPFFEAGAFHDLFARHDILIDQARKAAVTSLGKVHEALDDRQRKTLGDIIEAGPGYFGRWGSCRALD